MPITYQLNFQGYNFMSISSKVACLVTTLAIAIPTLAVAAPAPIFPEKHFQLTNEFREGNNECLVANSNGTSASMVECKNHLGQWWKATPAGNGYFKLTTQASQSKKECLERGVNGADVRNKVGSYMYSCKDESGQLWKATPAKTPAGEGYFKLTSQFREKANECLEGNAKGGAHNGVAFMDSCQDEAGGQFWKIKTINSK